ncbi:MAG: hypothetical protein ACPGWR_30355 [Ardenticatenaceae bacterium]
MNIRQWILQGAGAAWLCTEIGQAVKPYVIGNPDLVYWSGWLSLSVALLLGGQVAETYFKNKRQTDQLPDAEVQTLSDSTQQPDLAS